MFQKGSYIIILIISLTPLLLLCCNNDDDDGEPTAFSGTVSTHNKWRTAVGVPAISWSSEVADNAQSWANYLKANNGCSMIHSSSGYRTKNGVYWGENLAWSSSDYLTPGQVVDLWGNEISDYDYAGNTCAAGEQCGHYTQVVWNSSTEVGCGKATCNNGNTIWVCQYKPGGNYTGQRPY